jgi:hypothetical protein
LKYQHTAALRTTLADLYAPATANKMLAALRRVLKECWQLGLMTVEEYERAANVKAVKASTIPKGRHSRSMNWGSSWRPAQRTPARPGCATPP